MITIQMDVLPFGLPLDKIYRHSLLLQSRTLQKSTVYPSDPYSLRVSPSLQVPKRLGKTSELHSLHIITLGFYKHIAMAAMV